MKPFITYSGYVTYKIGHKRLTAHRLVATAFLEQNAPEVNHIDGVKAHNCPYNLEWCTRSHNMRHAFKMGVVKLNWRRGEELPWSKLTELSARAVLNDYKTCQHLPTLALKYGVHKATVHDLVRGKTWKHLHHLDAVAQPT